MSSSSANRATVSKQRREPARTGKFYVGPRFCKCKFLGETGGYCMKAYCACVRQGRPCNAQCSCDVAGKCGNCPKCEIVVIPDVSTPESSEAQPVEEARSDELADAHAKIAKLQAMLQKKTVEADDAKREVGHLYGQATSSKIQIAQLIREKDLLHTQLAVHEMRQEQTMQVATRVDDSEVDTGMFFD